MRRLVLLTPILFTVHLLEIAVMRLWLPRSLHGLISAQGQIALFGLLAVLVFFVALAALRRGKRSFPLYLLYGAQQVAVLNAFGCLIGAIIARGYVPGLVTGLFVNLPFAHDLFGRGLHEGYVTRRGLLYALMGALIVYLTLFVIIRVGGQEIPH